ncbi:MAG TPA: GvpL/GvpF family gas vesicle protein [Usitatibacter sp.]|nr:GvpL/GvpF family gas vesicle protein [Usitatibacter sp.]
MSAMFVLDSLMIAGIRGTLEAIARAADAAPRDVGLLRKALLDAAVRFEAGEIDAEELARIETRVLAGGDAPGSAAGSFPVADAPPPAEALPAGSLTHVHALLRAPRRPPMPPIAEALPGGGPLRLLAAGDGLWLAVSSVPARDYAQDALERSVRDVQWVAPRALAHEQVVGLFLCVPAVLPMQLFTLFESDARAVERVAADRERYEGILDRVARHAEWGLRLTWDERAAQSVGAATRNGASGTEYLARKRDVCDAGRRRRTAAQMHAEEVYAILARTAADCRRHGDIERAPGSPVLLDAAFLVPARRGAAFRRTLRRHEGLLRDAAIDVAFTGPWAPWNFV